MNLYFDELKEYISTKYEVKLINERRCCQKINNILGQDVNEDVRNVYENFEELEMAWFNSSGRLIGEIDFVAYKELTSANEELIEIMNESYDIETDEFDVKDDIMNWYPVFRFANGDAFCVDIRNGHIVFYEHDVFDQGPNIHGLIIAKSLNDLFYKWSQIHFANVYYWEKGTNENGIDLSSEIVQSFK